jgi:hypothetical protein
MVSPKEGVKNPSYNNAMTKNTGGRKITRPPFELLPHLKTTTSFDRSNTWKTMDINPESSHPKVVRIWELPKFLPQASTTS